MYSDIFISFPYMGYPKMEALTNKIVILSLKLNHFKNLVTQRANSFHHNLTNKGN